MVERMWSLKDCSKFLRISVVTIRRMIINKQFAKIKRIGGQIRVLDDDFFAWVKSQEDTIVEYDNIKSKRFLNKINKLRKGGINE